MSPNTLAALVILGPMLLLAAALCVGFLVDSILTYRKAKAECLLDAFGRYYSPALSPVDKRAPF